MNSIPVLRGVLVALGVLLGAWTTSLRGADEAAPQPTLKQWRASAERGDAEAQFQVGRAFDRGLGVATNATDAAKWYLRAAEQGHTKAQNNLAALYEEGRGELDAELTLAWSCTWMPFTTAPAGSLVRRAYSSLTKPYLARAFSRNARPSLLSSTIFGSKGVCLSKLARISAASARPARP